MINNNTTMRQSRRVIYYSFALVAFLTITLLSGMGWDLEVKSMTGEGTGYNESVPLWSPDGKYLAFERGSNEAKEVVIVDANGEEVQRVYTAGDKEADDLESELGIESDDFATTFNHEFCWSPDSLGFVFTGSSSLKVYNLYQGRIGEKEVKRLTKAKHDGMPSFSPDGKSVVFISARTGKGDVYLIDLESDETRQMTFGDDVELFPSFSPDGDKLVFVSGDSDNHDICVIDDLKDPKGSFRRLTDWVYDDISPAFSPDGTKVVFYTNYSPDGGEWSIIVIDSDGADPPRGSGLASKVVVSRIVKDTKVGPVFIPSGKGILYIESVSDKFNRINYIGLDGGDPRAINTRTKLNHDLNISGSGRLAWRAQVLRWDHIFTAQTGFKAKETE